MLPRLWGLSWDGFTRTLYGNPNFGCLQLPDVARN